jgi:hypothetical protein
MACSKAPRRSQARFIHLDGAEIGFDLMTSCSSGDLVLAMI